MYLYKKSSTCASKPPFPRSVSDNSTISNSTLWVSAITAVQYAHLLYKFYPY